MNAVLRRKPRLVELFLARGTYIYEVTDDGKNAYDLARSVRHVGILGSLEDKMEQMKMKQTLQKSKSPKNTKVAYRSNTFI